MNLWRSPRSLLTIALVLLAAIPAIAAGEFEKSPVVAIDFRADAPIDSVRLTTEVAVKVGKPLTVHDLQSSIDRLFASGDFRDVNIDAVAQGNGVHLTFVLALSYRVGSITFDGLPERRARSRKELVVRTGDVFSLDAVERSAMAIQKMLVRRGFLESSVDPETQFVREKDRADVIFHITAGPLARIQEIQTEGDISPFTNAQLISHLRRKPGDHFRPEEARLDADRLRNYLAKKNYRKADVRYLGDTYDNKSHGAISRFKVDVGPIVRVEVTGVPLRSVRKLIPFHGTDVYSEDIIDRASDAVVTNLQSRGYFEATVASDEKQVDKDWVVTFNVKPGAKYTLSAVVFRGNEKISRKKLLNVISIAPPGVLKRSVAATLRLQIGPTQTDLNNDRDAVEAYYRVQGFTEVKVGNPEPHAGPDGKLTVTFPITEGPRTMLTAVRVAGNDAIPLDKLPKPELKVGGPLDPQKLNQDLIALQTFYADKGYVELSVAPKVTFTPDKTGAEVVYNLSEGQAVSIDDVIVRGNTYTSGDVIIRKANLKKGEPFSYKAVLEAQRELYRLGIFNRVDILPQQTEASVAKRDVAIQVEEGKDLTFAGSIGYSTDTGAEGSISISHRDLFGTGRYLGIEMLISQLDNRYALNYRELFPLGLNLPTQLTVFEEDEREQPEARFRRKGTFVESSRILGGHTRWSLRYEYRVTKCVDGDLCTASSGNIPIPGIPREDNVIEVSSLTPSVFWDTRDDPINPHKGIFASSSLEYAFPLFQAKATFLKAFEQGSWYLPLTTNTAFVFDARVGLIEPLNDASGDEVPLSERFVAGGDSTQRAFKLDTLGIEGKTIVCLNSNDNTLAIVPCTRGGNIVALGGNGMVLMNGEYRFPIFGSLFGGLFLDAGNVWENISDIRAGGLRYGVGAGLRYVTPVGPVRVDFGFKLNRQSFEDPWAIFLTLGYPF